MTLCLVICIYLPPFLLPVAFSMKPPIFPCYFGYQKKKKDWLSAGEDSKHEMNKEPKPGFCTLRLEGITRLPPEQRVKLIDSIAVDFASAFIYISNQVRAGNLTTADLAPLEKVTNIIINTDSKYRRYLQRQRIDEATGALAKVKKSKHEIKDLLRGMRVVEEEYKRGVKRLEADAQKGGPQVGGESTEVDVEMRL